VVVMGRIGRWVIAGLLVLAVFAVVTWLAGAVVLPPWHALAPSDRWLIATAAGAALAAFAGLGGYGWVTRAVSEAPAGSSRTAAVGGDNTGINAAGDGTTNVQNR
jgi:hypothetical protein